MLDANAQFQSTWIKRPIWIKLDRLTSLLLLKYFRSSLSFIRNTDLACCQQPSRVPQQAPPAAMSVNLCRHSVRCAVQLRVCLFFLWVVPCRDVPIHDEASRRDSVDWDRDHMATYCASGPYHVFVFVLHFRNIMRFSCRFCDSSVQFFSAVPRSSALAQLYTPLMHAMNSKSVLTAHVLAGLLTAGCCLHWLRLTPCRLIFFCVSGFWTIFPHALLPSHARVCLARDLVPHFVDGGSNLLLFLDCC